MRGITLVELMLVVALVAVLAAIALPSYQGYMERGKVAQAMSDIRSIEVLLAQYLADHRSFPDTLAEANAGNLVDPWGNPYRYLNLDSASARGHARKDHSLVPINSDYDLYSMGKDGRSVPPLTGKPSRDDIVRGRNGRFVGAAADF